MGEHRRNDPRRRLTVAQAADQLGISIDAMRARVKRGTVATERQEGRVYVLLDNDLDAAQDAPRSGESSALTSELRDRLRYVEGQLEAERQAHAEARRLLAAALERIPAIEAPSEADERDEASEATVGDEVVEESGPRTDNTGRPAAVRRPWWRRIIGG